MNILVQRWEESERGWGTRPDGYSIHLSKKDLDIFINEYWEKMPNQVPDVYSRPYGEPFWKIVCDEKVDLFITEITGKPGIWCHRLSRFIDP